MSNAKRCLTLNELRVLRNLESCAIGKGIPLGDEDRKASRILVSRGLVEWIEGGGLRVFKITRLGRNHVELLR